ncbi:hypothetical protein TraAM80_01457 [Trypanosoma rangeli]|uniref:Cilium assembly protein DZIP1 N-terminal domain-containing protein n=1 Tax=Trypanosoma rangeli TaxID=5698 RepID=A0A422NYY8_TRYRA|nr:uncharacterized protein TraAM80_01457 [Trypanosoma rangeli]RNF10641.1 hypothetical protein TraAM80_01457 [Trypanosoma rangeli]|eukprot:RNF10641.1 hypothetical protein TraAM80_01457 [Trypanosoma rangeli]
MSVADRLRAFRYVTGAREIPWTHLRSVDVAAHRVQEPELHMMKNLISLLSDCSLVGATSPTTGTTDVYQLLSVMQLALQFTLWSQSVLKEELVEKQSGGVVQRINSQYVEGLEKKLESSRQEAITLREERDSMQLASRSLEHRLTQAEATIRCLEKDLAFERQRLKEAMTLFATRPQEDPQQPSKKKLRQRQLQELFVPTSKTMPIPQPSLPYYSQRHADEVPQGGREGVYTRPRHQNEIDKGPQRQECSFISDGDAVIKSFFRGEEPMCVGQQHRGDECATLLRQLLQLRQEGTCSSPLPPANERPRRVGDAETPASILNVLHDDIKEAQAQIVATSQAACRSLESAVASSLQRTEAMVQRAEQCMDTFRTALLESGAKTMSAAENSSFSS